MNTATNIKTAAAKVETGVTQPAEVAGKLTEVLAATYELVLRTHEVHWNVEGPLFYAVHMLTEAQYGELFDATDVVAERIRALGALTPTQPASLIGLDGTGDGDEAARRPGAIAMVSSLCARHEALARLCHETIALADRSGDPVSADLCTARSAAHEKAAWMLRSLASG